MRRIRAIPVAFLALSFIYGAQADEPKPTVSNDPLSTEQVAIYRAALADFKPSRGRTPQLANITVPLNAPARAFENCVVGIREPSEHDPHPLVHRLDSSVVAGLDLPLVDPWQVPQMRHGPPDPKAPHLGLLSLSEIAFDKDHLHAIVTYDFNCGGLCGHGKMLSLSKLGEEWTISKVCVRWFY